jgi:hypothetical protein
MDSGLYVLFYTLLRKFGGACWMFNQAAPDIDEQCRVLQTKKGEEETIFY